MYKDITDNYKKIYENIQNAKIKANRFDTVKIMAVTKTVEVDRINSAISCGVELIGENRVQEFLQKKSGYPALPELEIHFIGSLQTNKVKQIIGKVDMLQSVDSVRLVGEINRLSLQNGLVTDVLIQVNIAGEATKSGVMPEELDDLVGIIDLSQGTRFRGLMAIPPFGDSIRYFGRMQKLFEDLKRKYSECDTLSIGMSADYSVAVEYGATIVRLGTALFGNR